MDLFLCVDIRHLLLSLVPFPRILAIDLFDLVVAEDAYADRSAIESDLNEAHYDGNSHAAALREHDQLCESIERACTD